MDRYLTERQRLIETAAPGIDSARRLALLTDEALRRLVADAAPKQPRGRWALLALGGYGAGVLLPGSDIDVLVVFEGRPADVKPFIESLLYPLWDAGLHVGHQVRTPTDHVRVARSDTTVLTATLTGRTIAGDDRLGGRALAACADFARAKSKHVVRALFARERPGSPYLLEPDLKNGAGGRRDYDELTWLAATLMGQPSSSPTSLVARGVLRADEFARLEAAAEVVAAARWELSAAGLGSLMSLEAAQGLTTDPQAVQCALSDTAHTLTRVRRRVGSSDLPDLPLSAEDLLALVAQGESSLPELEEAVWTGRAEHVLPGMRFVLPLRRPALTHTLTVGAHCLRSAAIAARLGTDKASDGPLGQSRALIADRRVLAVAALAHDLGKASDGTGHALAGASLAREVASRFGLSERAADDVADLVRLHLVLVETALHQDLDSEDAILRVVSKVGRRELVAPLHVLTVADSLATGPGAWSPWHEALVATLAARLDNALSDEYDGAGLASRGETVRAEALARVADPAGVGADRRDEPTTESEMSVRRFVDTLPLRYLAGRHPEQVIRDAVLMTTLQPRARPHDARVAVRPGPIPRTFEVTVVAADRPELFARIAGALALSGLDILSADAYGTGGGVALDVFVVASATLAAVVPETWERFERYLHAALADRLELEVRLAARRKHQPTPRSGHVNVRTDVSSGYDTAVLVEAPDRLGLLYDVARAISLEDLDIRWAKVVTSQGLARDVFHVVGADGQAPTDPGVLGHLAMRVRERLAAGSGNGRTR